MAAHRNPGPLFHIEELFSVKDGTECRMPSPAPGPLRGSENDLKPGGVSDDMSAVSPAEPGPGSGIRSGK